nr:uncharacterized protein LOC105498398 [Macaca nemestrina]
MAGGRSPRPTRESPTLTLPGSPPGWVGLSFGLVAEFFPNWLRAAWMQNLLLQSRPQPAPLGLVLFCSSHRAARPRHRPGHWEERGARAGGVPRLMSSAEEATRVDRQLQTIGQLTSRSLLHPTPPRSSRPFRLRFSIIRIFFLNVDPPRPHPSVASIIQSLQRGSAVTLLALLLGLSAGLMRCTQPRLLCSSKEAGTRRQRS